MKDEATSPAGERKIAAPVTLRIDEHSFLADLQVERAPRTCSRFRNLLPFRGPLIHARWSGEAAWMPLGDLDLGLGPENATSYPAPGEMLLYPGGASECEILLAYGASRFASRAGQLAGNPLLRIRSPGQRLAEIGRKLLWSGSMAVAVEPIGDMPLLRG